MMKRTISLLSVLAFVLAFSGSTFAQTQVTASATIDAALTASVDQDIAFGTLSSAQNIDATIDPKNGNSNTGTGTITQGEVTITGTANTAVDISYTTSDLSDGSGNTLTLNELVYGNNTYDASTSSQLTSGVQTVTTSDPAGEYFIFLGGTIPGGDINGATGGTYTGDITLNISYN